MERTTPRPVDFKLPTVNNQINQIKKFLFKVGTFYNANNLPDA